MPRREPCAAPTLRRASRIAIASSAPAWRPWLQTANDADSPDICPRFARRWPCNADIRGWRRGCSDERRSLLAAAHQARFHLRLVIVPAEFHMATHAGAGGYGD